MPAMRALPLPLAAAVIVVGVIVVVVSLALGEAAEREQSAGAPPAAAAQPAAQPSSRVHMGHRARSRTSAAEVLSAEYECRPAGAYRGGPRGRLVCRGRRGPSRLAACESQPDSRQTPQSPACDQLCGQRADDSGAQCVCYRGFRRLHGACRDVDECAAGNGGCEHECRNTAGSHYCACPAGLRLGDDRRSCVDINECLLRNGHGPCQDTCRNTWGGYECACSDRPGTRLAPDNHTCADMDECANGAAGCSHSCLNTFGSAFCLCPAGYALGDDWRTCQDIDECSYDEFQTERCELGCVNTIGSYHCLQYKGNNETALTEMPVVCPPGYRMGVDGTCEDIDECKEKISGCEQGCLNILGGYQCYCGLGFFLAADNKKCNEGKEAVCPPLEAPPVGYLECARHLIRTSKSKIPWMKRTRVVNHAGAICQLRCPHGYVLEGKYLKVCGQDSMWKGPEDGSCVCDFHYSFNVILKF